MILPEYDNDWPLDVKQSYQYDLLEMFGDRSMPGYTYAYLNRFNKVMHAVEDNLPKGSRILDIAAAQGNFSIGLAEKGYHVLWNDLRTNLIPYVQQKYNGPNLEFEAGNIFERLNSKKFDGIIITEIIEHVAHPDEFLCKISSLLNEGGFAFLTTPLGNYFQNKLPRFTDTANPEIFEKDQFKPNADGHIFLLFVDEFIPLANAAGLKILKHEWYTNILTNGHLGTSSLLKVLPESFVNGIEKATQKLPSWLSKKMHTNQFVLLQK